uniref:Uncharacterized protein n=1 Tax=Panagrolaimus sp. JU765 TaxID=591449 RepID=A0AC34RD14_9BILA
MKNANPIFRYLVKRFDRMLLSLTTTKGTTPKVRKVAKLETTTTANPTTKILSTTAENLTALDFPNSSLSTTTQVFDFPTTTIEEILSSTSQIFLDPTLPSTTIDVDETNITQDISSTFPTETTTESTTELVPSSVFTLDEFSTTSETNAPEIVPEIPDAISDSATDAPHEVDESLNSKIGRFFGDERYGILFVVFLTQSGSAEVPEIKVIKKEDPNQMKEVTAEEPVETIKISKENPSKKETTLNKPVPSSDASSKKEVNMPQSTMTKTKTEMLMVEEPIPPTPSALTPAPSSISQVDKQSMQFAGSKTADAQSFPELAATVTASRIGD